MNGREIIARILDGQSLRTRMVPDPVLPSNFPEHIETYDLPHVIIKGDLFWGKSETAHLSINKATSEPVTSFCFCYTNSTDLFASFAPGMPNGTFVMHLSRYREHDWVLKKDYRLIWDSEGGQPAEAVRDEINAAAKFRIAMLDSEDVWNVHPVDLPMYYPDSGTFELKTVADWYILQTRAPADLACLLKASIAKIGDSMEVKHALAVDLPQFSTFYNLRSDGTYQNYYDLPRRTRQEYKALRIFSDGV